jgi:hypothetical protein
MSLTHVSEIVPRSNILGAPDQSLPSEPLFARYLNTPSPPTVHLPAETRFRHRRITSSQSAAEPRPRGPCAYRDSRCESRSPSKWGLLLTASRHHKHIKKWRSQGFLRSRHTPLRNTSLRIAYSKICASELQYPSTHHTLRTCKEQDIHQGQWRLSVLDASTR